jgi:hypothetical protein
VPVRVMVPLVLSTVGALASSLACPRCRAASPSRPVAVSGHGDLLRVDLRVPEELVTDVHSSCSLSIAVLLSSWRQRWVLLAKVRASAGRSDQGNL